MSLSTWMSLGRSMVGGVDGWRAHRFMPGSDHRQLDDLSRGLDDAIGGGQRDQGYAALIGQ
jgi:hypothetical protein